MLYNQTKIVKKWNREKMKNISKEALKYLNNNAIQEGIG